ncbi:hypothetical protein HMPREF9946_05227 [Acetobacteraceae bacterium AT-5844]|nr:hypothetical protein HMPREF9946_05227 [Acetobacteraceae bacterium AT-5844]
MPVAEFIEHAVELGGDTGAVLLISRRSAWKGRGCAEHVEQRLAQFFEFGVCDWGSAELFAHGAAQGLVERGGRVSHRFHAKVLD